VGELEGEVEHGRDYDRKRGAEMSATSIDAG
jgi:hypothetical protein